MTDESRLQRELHRARAYAQSVCQPMPIVIVCETCDEMHVAEYSHRSTHSDDQHPVYASVCPQDWLTDYWTGEAAINYLPTSQLRGTMIGGLEFVTTERTR